MTQARISAIEYRERARRTKKQTEQSFQIKLISDLRKILPFPECFMTAFPAGGGGKMRGIFLKSMGLIPGFPDLLLIYQGCAYGMELKTPNGRMKPSQHDAHESLGRAGMDVRVVRSMDEALDALKAWSIPARHFA